MVISTITDSDITNRYMEPNRIDYIAILLFQITFVKG